MKLTEKDKDFLTKLKTLTSSKQLWVELRPGEPSYLVLRGVYGRKIERDFGLTRQGVRWRFHRVMDMYISAFEAILMIERLFGSNLREHAVRISRERFALHQKTREVSFGDAGDLSRGRDG